MKRSLVLQRFLTLWLTTFGALNVFAQDTVMTVTGSLSENQMGLTLVHEHILVDFIGAEETGYHRWNREEVMKVVLPFLLEAKRKGVETILECTPAYLGRDPQLLKALSEKSGITILTNTGYYGAADDKFIPEFAYEIDEDSMAAIWIKEFEEGIEKTGIKPGFIKISVDSDSILSAIDEKIFKAAIKTHLATGLTIVSHTGPDGPAFAQLKLLEQANISNEAWVWTHAQAGTMAGIIRAGKSKAWISIDDISKDKLENRVEILLKFKSLDLLDQLLISHDAGWYSPEEPERGDFRGYTDIFTHLVPMLLDKGFSQEEIDQLLIKNPERAFAVKIRIR